MVEIIPEVQVKNTEAGMTIVVGNSTELESVNAWAASSTIADPIVGYGIAMGTVLATRDLSPVRSRGRLKEHELALFMYF